jgi:endo-1,4-beta-xylanase
MERKWRRGKMARKWLIKSLFVAGAMYASTGTAHAVCGGNGLSGTYNSTFWTWYTDNSTGNGGYSGNECMFVNNANNARKKTANAYWYIDDGANDVVGGIGYSGGVTSGTIRYKYDYFRTQKYNSSTGSKAYGTLYGWSCAGRDRNPQEYYVVENWDGTSFVPYDNSQGKSATAVTTLSANGHTYDMYITTQNNQPHACGSGTKTFTQYWSVRRTKRWEGDIDIGAHMTAWSSSSRGFVTSGVANGYQVMGIEGVIDSTGEAAWSVERI